MSAPSDTEIRSARGVVVWCPRGPDEDPRSHESVTRRALAGRIAALTGYADLGEYDERQAYPGPVYFVPADTLVGVEAAHALGIHREEDFFGGVVPFPFVATKSITHPLVHENAVAPRGWCADFGRSLGDAVLPGYTAFDLDDARAGAMKLLSRGALRVKPALAIGGRGQVVVTDLKELDAALASTDADALAAYGVALELNMTAVTTFSVGKIRVAGATATYFGTQKLTRDNDGAEVYGGSRLTVVPGGFDALLALATGDERRAVERARLYDAAAERCFPGFFASRRNYDVVQGNDPDGRSLCGVLEQSWRAGGASGAELAALEAFRDDPTLRAVEVECSEIYGESPEPPATATVYFRGIDPVVGPITKYTVVKRHVHA